MAGHKTTGIKALSSFDIFVLYDGSNVFLKHLIEKNAILSVSGWG